MKSYEVAKNKNTMEFKPVIAKNEAVFEKTVIPALIPETANKPVIVHSELKKEDDRKYCGYIIIDDVRKDVLCKSVPDQNTGALSAFENPLY